MSPTIVLSQYVPPTIDHVAWNVSLIQDDKKTHIAFHVAELHNVVSFGWGRHSSKKNKITP